MFCFLIDSPTGKKKNKRSPTTNITIAGTKNDQALQYTGRCFSVFPKTDKKLRRGKAKNYCRIKEL